MAAQFKFKLGDIYQAKFPFEEDEHQCKERAVFVWRFHDNRQEVLSSKITGSIGRSGWELVLQPSSHSGLTKQCAIRIDQTKYLSITSFLYPRGTLNAFEIAAIQRVFMKYINCDEAS
ncbi:MAG: hypothetical protein LBU13_09215 [Synergistaceae bacterium]|jgi:hypothetical protein|nr:hypothetical protein [Synergistaceae bacterium]